mgnify:CR=1 FL=1
MSEEVWTVIKYKPKEGCEEEFLDSLKGLKKMMADNKEYDFVNESIKIDGTGEYVQIARMPNIDAIIDGQIEGLEWLDSVDHLLDKYEDESRTDAFSGISLPIDVD